MAIRTFHISIMVTKEELASIHASAAITNVMPLEEVSDGDVNGFLVDALEAAVQAVLAQYPVAPAPLTNKEEDR